jgi:hypothetical protein
VAHGSPITKGKHTIDANTTLDSEGNAIPDGWLTLYAVTHADDSTLLEGAVLYSFVSKHIDSEWRDLGMTTFNDDTFGRMFLWSYDVPAPKQVQLYQNIADPRRFRILNAFATSSLSGFDAEEMVETGHNHYTEIVIARPDSVYIPERPMGLNIDDELITLSDNAAEKGPGTLVDRTVTFPVKGLALTSNYGYSTYGNYSGAFSLFIPRYDINVVVTSGEQPVEGATVTVGDFSAVTDATGLAVVSTYGLKGESATATALSADRTLSGTATFELEEGNYDYLITLPLNATALDKITAAPAADPAAPVYDLNGRRISSPAQQGIYIKGGKKVVY